VALPAFAAARRAATRLLLSVEQQSIDLLLTGPAAANEQQRSATGEWNRQTDGHRIVT